MTRDNLAMAQNWVMMISELHRYQGVSYKSDIIVISGATTVLPTPCKLQIVLPKHKTEKY